VTTVQPNAFVIVAYTLRDSEGDIVDGSDPEMGGEPIEYVHGYGMLVPGLEIGLAGLKIGETKEIHVSPEEGFGLRDEELVMLVDREDFPAEVAEGDEFIAESDEGDEAVMHVVEVRDDGIVVDGNHPLAGESLCYSVTITEVRAATDEEIEKAAQELSEAEDEADPPPPPPEVVSLSGAKKKNLLN
jgi:FKBP-type peptidyl-prolyl cis-trans isomerase SlyD